jgi:uncharacterized membrane protein YfcA
VTARPATATGYNVRLRTFKEGLHVEVALSAVVAGLLAGLVLGYLGAGGTVVGLPLVLYVAHLRPHLALGTNALGVSAIAAALFAWRTRDRGLPWRHGLVFAFPGLAGIYCGARLGLVYPGQRLVFLLGILLFVVAAWLFYLSTRPEPEASADQRPGSAEPAPRPAPARWPLLATAFAVGCTAGFFAIGGGFMIVPALALAGGLELAQAAAAALLPIAAFSGWVGLQYWAAGNADPTLAGAMLAPGLAGGFLGMDLGRRLSRRTTQRVFAAFLVALAIYMSFK